MDCHLQIRTRGFRLAALLLWAAAFSCLAGSLSAAGDIAAPRLLGSPGAPPAVWVMADFNRDGELDLVIVGAPGPDGQPGRQGLPHQLDVQLSAPRVPALSHPLFMSGNRLNVRDLDGDSDRDILLETPFRELIAVWINDGTGHFHEGNVDSFRFQLAHDDRRSLDSGERPSTPSQIGECPSRDAASSRCASFDLTSPGATLIAGREERARAVHPSAIRTRGPPSHS
jgi:hypothetical protein